MTEPLDKNSPEYAFSREKMTVMGDTLKAVFPGMCWALLVSNFEAPGIGNYISNGSREDMIKSLRETADRLEEGL